MRDIQYEHTDRPPENLWDKNFELQKSSIDEGFPNGENDDIVVYTDGSKLDIGCTSAGYVIYDSYVEEKTQAFHLGKHNTVFQGEIYAIFAAARALENLELEDRTITIYSDSRAAQR